MEAWQAGAKCGPRHRKLWCWFSELTVEPCSQLLETWENAGPSMDALDPPYRLPFKATLSDLQTHP